MNARHAVLLLGMTGLLVGGAAAPALAGPSASAGTAGGGVCTIEVLDLKANDLQEETNDGDEIKVKLDDTMFGPWDFQDNQYRSSSLGGPEEDFVNSVTVKLYEVDAVTRTLIDSFSTGCNVGEDKAVLRDSRAVYTMNYRITA